MLSLSSSQEKVFPDVNTKADEKSGVFQVNRSSTYYGDRKKSDESVVEASASFRSSLKKPDIRKNLKELAILFCLYTLQGVPMGLGGSIPFLLQGRVSYAKLGVFSLVSLPFSLKLLWAPVVDSVYWRRFGRRKSWLVPVQLACGLLMIWGSASTNVDTWLGRPVWPGSSQETNAQLTPAADVASLSWFFAALYFLMATQDIAVDGWSLSLLEPENRVYASPCNCAGQTFGYCCTYVGFLALYDPGICNKWLRSAGKAQPYGLVTLGSFLRICGFLIMTLTLLIGFFKSEREDTEETADLGLQSSPTRRCPKAGVVYIGVQTVSDASCTGRNQEVQMVELEGRPSPESARTSMSTARCDLMGDVRLISRSPRKRPAKLSNRGDPLLEESTVATTRHEEEWSSKEAQSSDGSSNRLLLPKSGATGSFLAVAAGHSRLEKDQGLDRRPGGPFVTEVNDLSAGGPLRAPQTDAVVGFPDTEVNLGIKETYLVLLSLVQSKPVQLLMLVLLTCRIPFAALDSSNLLKLVERGMPRDQIALLSPLLLPFGIISPVLVNRMSSHNKPMRLFLVGFQLKLLVGLVWTLLLPLASTVYDSRSVDLRQLEVALPPTSQSAAFGNNTIANSESITPPWFFAMVLLLACAHSFVSDIMFVSQMSFFAKIADPLVGGTYMTFLNTISNLGAKYPATINLWMMDHSNLRLNGLTYLDGYITNTLVFTSLGLLLYRFLSRLIQRIEATPGFKWNINGFATSGSNGRSNTRRLT